MIFLPHLDESIVISLMYLLSFSILTIQEPSIVKISSLGVIELVMLISLGDNIVLDVVGGIDWVVVVELLDIIVAGTVCCWLHVLICFTIDVDFLRCVYFNAVFFDQKTCRCLFRW